MTNLAKNTGVNAEISRLTLEQMLVTMELHGHPRVARHKGGWLCIVEMHVSATGCQFKVSSEFDHATPSAAAAECLGRIEKAIKDLKQ